MPLRDYQYWIFDMDGTLTMPVHDFNAIRAELGIEQNTPILEAIAAMPADQASSIHKQLHDIEMDIAALGKAQPGAEELLDKLIENGGKLGILTRNDEDIAVATLQASGLDQYFELPYIIGRETCAPKPAPDGVLHLADLWSISPASSVMIGDYRYDMEAGKKAGARTIHFDSNGQFNWPEFTDHNVTRLADISTLIGRG